MFTVLVVDDDRELVDMVAEGLCSDAIEIQGISDPETAVQMVRDIEPDVVVIDLMLATRSGIEVAREIRDVDVQVPLIAQTGSAYLAEVARESGLFVEVLEKPFDLDTLICAVAVPLPA